MNNLKYLKGKKYYFYAKKLLVKYEHSEQSLGDEIYSSIKSKLDSYDFIAYKIQ